MLDKRGPESPSSSSKPLHSIMERKRRGSSLFRELLEERRYLLKNYKIQEEERRKAYYKGKYRYFLFLIACIQSLITSGVMLGWASLVFVLKSDHNLYAERCPREEHSQEEHGMISCSEQERALHFVYTVGIVGMYLSYLAFGWFMDTFGVKRATIVGSMTFGMGSGLLAIAHTQRTPFPPNCFVKLYNPPTVTFWFCRGGLVSIWHGSCGSGGRCHTASCPPICQSFSMQGTNSCKLLPSPPPAPLSLSLSLLSLWVCLILTYALAILYSRCLFSLPLFRPAVWSFMPLRCVKNHLSPLPLSPPQDSSDSFQLPVVLGVLGPGCGMVFRRYDRCCCLLFSYCSSLLAQQSLH